jgi:hypothetical protein
MMRNLIKKILKEGEFDWIESTPEASNYGGHPQGVVHLRSHDEISEFIELLKEYNDGWEGPFDEGYMSYHQAYDHTLDSFEAGDFDDGWHPTLSASFFINNKYPKDKLVSGYWDYDVESDSIKEWLGDDVHIVDKENWTLYSDLSDVKRLFKSISN